MSNRADNKTWQKNHGKQKCLDSFALTDCGKKGEDAFGVGIRRKKSFRRQHRWIEKEVL